MDFRNLVAGTNKIIVGNANTSGLVYNNGTNNPVSTVATAGQVNAACYSDDNLYYAFGGVDKKIYIMFDNDTVSGTLSGPTTTILSCVFSQNGEYLIVGTTSATSPTQVYRKTCFDCPAGYYASSSVSCTSCTALLSMKGCSYC